MKTRALPLALLFACGTWSNEDVEYVLALPLGETVRSNLGGMGSSEGFEHTRRAAAELNGIPATVLGVLETLRTTPPTTRTATSRIWGPYDDLERPGHQNQAEIHRETDTLFTWAIKTRRTGDRFQAVAFGDAVATGEGHFVLAVPEAHLETGYVTREDPTVVQLDARGPDGGTLQYTYRGWRDGSGTLELGLNTVTVTASWRSDGSGRIDAPDAGECWNGERTAVACAP
ncbi:MAG: hypothetical protein JNK82_07505 [Myxococcaceae bacterium]|nr:hypothetical protein [Myxococcaceae bacterium]